MPQIIATGSLPIRRNRHFLGLQKIGWLWRRFWSDPFIAYIKRPLAIFIGIFLNYPALPGLHILHTFLQTSIALALFRILKRMSVRTISYAFRYQPARHLNSYSLLSLTPHHFSFEEVYFKTHDSHTRIRRVYFLPTNVLVSAYTCVRAASVVVSSYLHFLLSSEKSLKLFCIVFVEPQYVNEG